MNSENFCYWLQGFVEIHGGMPDEGQWYMIKEHLQLVFKKETMSKEEIKGQLTYPHTSFPLPLAATC